MKNAIQQRTLPLSSGTLTYTLTRKRVKNINLRIHPDGRVAVSAGAWVPLSAIEAFLRREEPFILAAERRRAAALQSRPRPLTLSPGEQLPIGGILRTVCVEKAVRDRKAEQLMGYVPMRQYSLFGEEAPADKAKKKNGKN